MSGFESVVLLTLGRQLGVLRLQLRDPRPQPRGLLLGRLVDHHASRDPPRLGLERGAGQRPVSSRLLAGPVPLEPVPQRAPLDAQVLGDATHRRARSGLVQVDGLPTELLGVVLAGHGSGSSRSLPRMRDSACPRTRVRAPHLGEADRLRVDPADRGRGSAPAAGGATARLSSEQPRGSQEMSRLDVENPLAAPEDAASEYLQSRRIG